MAARGLGIPDVEVRAWEGRQEGSKRKGMGREGEEDTRAHSERGGAKVGCGSLRPWQGVAS